MRLLAPALAALLAAPAAGAADPASFHTANRSPLVQIFGLPAMQAQPLMRDGASDLGIAFDVASHWEIATGPRETLILDGETYRTTLLFRQGLPGGREWGLEVPWVAHRGGDLDSFIIDWHGWLGLPQSGRDRQPQDLLAYRYFRDGVEVLTLDRSAEGLGDVRLSGAWALEVGTVLRAALKLPTGDSGRLLGSGAPDLALWATRHLAFGDLAFSAATGLLVLGRGDVLPDQQRRFAAFGGVTLAWAATPAVAFKAQLDAHSPFYRQSALDALNSESVQLGLGGTLRVSRRAALDLAVVEDAVVATAPDVTFHVRFHVSY